MIPANEDTLKKRIHELRYLIDSHDCHLSRDSGCECQDWRDELVKLVQTQYVIRTNDKTEFDELVAIYRDEIPKVAFPDEVKNEYV